MIQPCFAQETQEPPPPEGKPKLIIGTFAEFSKDPVFNYNLNYSSIEFDGFKLQYDIFNNPVDYQRIWINPHKFTITESEDFVLKVAPGFSVSNSLNDQPNDWLFGADVEYILPAARVQILQRSYKGNHFDQHYLFSTWQPIKDEDQFLLMHFMNISSEFPSTSYVGPAANLMDGHLFFWAGISTTRNAIWATNLQATIQF
jgi:hypothetical protein